MATNDKSNMLVTQFDNTLDAGIVLTPSTPPPSPVAHSEKNVVWKAVAIGGTSGILIGSGAMLANMTAAASTAEVSPTEDLGETESLEIAPPEIAAEAEASQPVVADVSGGLSFNEAFREARTEVGPGGVFTWHGGVYSTYIAEEWDAMSTEERNAYIHSISPEIYAEAAHDHSSNHSHVHHVDVDGSLHNEASGVEHVSETPENNQDESVRFLGLSALGENEDGSTNYAGIAAVDGHVAIFANTDRDAENTFDQVWVDINDNENVDYDEVADISDLGMTAGDFANLVEDPSVIEEPIGANEIPMSDEYSAQSEIANDMPDYIDDADVNL